MTLLAHNHIYDLEIRLRSMGEGRYSADMQFNDPASAAPVDFATDVSITLDYVALRTVTNDPTRYGALLSVMLFADTQMRDGWTRSIGYTEGGKAALRLRLRLDGDDALLHAIHWETLQHPQTGRFFAIDERILLSRYLTSTESAPVVRRSPGAMRALVLIANPSNLARYRLAPVNVAAEAEHALTALGELQPDVIASNVKEQRATLPALIGAARGGYDIIYVVAHGQFVEGKPSLCLEDEHGNVAWATGTVITDALCQITRRPTLVILAACETAGNDYEAPLSALGPDLIQAGVPAVLAMQGKISMIAVERMMPIFLRELQRDGMIDRALAAARAVGRDLLDWWRPVLYTRLRDGRIWEEHISTIPDLPTTSLKPKSVQANSSLTKEEARLLTNALLGCPSMMDDSVREAVIRQLPETIRKARTRLPRTDADVRTLVAVCNNYADGLRSLLAEIRFYDEGTPAMAEVDLLVQRLRPALLEM